MPVDALEVKYKRIEIKEHNSVRKIMVQLFKRSGNHLVTSSIVYVDCTILMNVNASTFMLFHS